MPRVGRRDEVYRPGQKKRKFLNATTLNRLEKRLSRLENMNVSGGLVSQWNDSGQSLGLQERVDNFEFGILIDDVSPYCTGRVYLIDDDLVVCEKPEYNEDFLLEDVYDLCGKYTFGEACEGIPVIVFRLPRSNSRQYGFWPCPTCDFSSSSSSSSSTTTTTEPTTTEEFPITCYQWIWCCEDVKLIGKCANPILCSNGTWVPRGHDCLDSIPPISGTYHGQLETICICEQSTSTSETTTTTTEPTTTTTTTSSSSSTTSSTTSTTSSTTSTTSSTTTEEPTSTEEPSTTEEPTSTEEPDYCIQFCAGRTDPFPDTLTAEITVTPGVLCEDEVEANSPYIVTLTRNTPNSPHWSGTFVTRPGRPPSLVAVSCTGGFGGLWTLGGTIVFDAVAPSSCDPLVIDFHSAGNGDFYGCGTVSVLVYETAAPSLVRMLGDPLMLSGEFVTLT